MTKTSTKKAAGKLAGKPAKKSQTPPSPMFVFGFDDNGKPRGARFPSIKDDVASAAIDMKCKVVGHAPDHVTDLGNRLPLGRVYANGRLFIPNIRRDLYDKLAAAVRKMDQPKGNPAKAAPDETLPGNMVSRGLPRDWDTIAAGDMVLFHLSDDDGWWEAIVTTREHDVLTLRYRDFPKEPTLIRHISTVARIFPGNL